jgi:hypothetical protein
MIYGTGLHCFPVSDEHLSLQKRVQDWDQQPLKSATLTIAQYLLQARYGLLNHYLSVFVLTSMRHHIVEMFIY